VKQKEFGVKGPEVTIIGAGTRSIDRGDRKSAVAARRLGVHIDTAEMYGGAEPSERGRRQEITLSAADVKELSSMVTESDRPGRDLAFI